MHVGEQPSPGVSFSSSQVSASAILPSPHRFGMTSGLLHPVTARWQFLLHDNAPSPRPSDAHVAPPKSSVSQTSRPRTRPSPQMLRQPPGPAVWHNQPSSWTHVAEHPSPSITLPSSHVSVLDTEASPQTLATGILLSAHPQRVSRRRGNINFRIRASSYDVKANIVREDAPYFQSSLPSIFICMTIDSSANVEV